MSVHGTRVAEAKLSGFLLHLTQDPWSCHLTGRLQSWERQRLGSRDALVSAKQEGVKPQPQPST